MKLHLYLSLSVLLGGLGCRAQDQPAPAVDYARVPGPDTTFYQEVSWSPDGSKLFLSRLDIHLGYRSTIAVVNTDGSGYAELAPGPGDRWTSSSPDGSRIAFASTRDGNQDIYVMDLDDGETVRLTVSPASDTHPDWSPDGEKIAFVSNREGAADIYLMSAGGSGQTRISSGPEEEGNPRWSPDNQRITYYGSIDGASDSVYVMNADGTDKRALVAGVWPSWSTDGSRILFVHDDSLFSLALDTEVRSLQVANALSGRWSPEGSRLSVIRTTWRAPGGWPSTSDVFVIGADGSGEIRVTGLDGY